MTLQKVCAWCQAELGEVESTYSGTTHGICASCHFRVEIKELIRWNTLRPGFKLAHFGDQGTILISQDSGCFLFSSGIQVTDEMLSRLCDAMQDEKKKVPIKSSN